MRVLLPTDFDKGSLTYCDQKPVIRTEGHDTVAGYYHPVTVKVRQLGNKKCAGSTIRYNDVTNDVQKEYMLPQILPG